MIFFCFYDSAAADCVYGQRNSSGNVGAPNGLNEEQNIVLRMAKAQLHVFLLSEHSNRDYNKWLDDKTAEVMKTPEFISLVDDARRNAAKVGF